MKPLRVFLSLLLLVTLIAAATLSQTARALDLPGLPDLPLPDLPLPDLPLPDLPLPDLPDIPIPDLPRIPVIPSITTKPDVVVPIPDLKLPDITLKPIITPKPDVVIPIPDLKLPDITLIPIITPKPDLKIPIPDRPNIPLLPLPLPEPKPTEKPGVSGGGHILTSEGPPFMVFRSDLTGEPWMFTPMDLSLDGELRFPLIGDANQVVGQVKVVVQSGVAVVTCEVIKGVQIDAKKEFFTFFPNVRDITTILPADLQAVRMIFGMPYPVAAWLNTDQKVLLYVNCPAAYNTALGGLAPFSFQDAGYLSRLSELLPLMD